MNAKQIGTLVACAGLLAACDEPLPQGRRGTQAGGGTGATADGQRPSAAPAPTCPAVAAPQSLATDVDASDLHVAGDSVFFRAGTKLVQIKKDGTGRTELYTAQDLVHVYTDASSLVAVEGQGNAVLRVAAIGTDPKRAPQIDTDLQAVSTNIFGADATNLFAVGETDGGDNIYKIARKDAGGVETVTETKGVVTDAQVAGGALWYVLEQTEIHKLAVTGGEPALVATVPAGCSLAVGTTHIYCSTAGALEERDLAGANPRKVVGRPIYQAADPRAAAEAIAREAGVNEL